MATNVNKAKLLAKMKKVSKGAWDKARNAPTKVKGQTLPGGIVNGVAQLTDQEFTEDKKGTVYFKLGFTVFEPEEFAGCKHSIFHRMNATKTKTVADKLAELSSDLQILGMDTAGVDEDDLPDLCQQAKDSAPFVYFNTWKPPATKDFPDPNTMMFLQRLATDWNPPDEDAGEVVEEEGEPEAEVEAPPPPKATGKGKKPAPKPAPEPEPEPDEGESDWTPAEGEIYNYKTNPKVKASEHEVVAVDEENRTVDLKAVATGKVFKTVSWDKLEGAE